MANPTKPTKPSDKTTPEAFIAETAQGLQSPEPDPMMADPMATSTPAPSTSKSPAPDAVPAKPADPFVLISRAGSTDKVARSLRAMAVPGGVVLKSTFAIVPDPVPKGETLCFVPSVELKDIQAFFA